MALTKEQKQKILEDLKDKIARQRAMVFADFTGLKVKDLSDLRRKLKAADCELKVAKKTLMGIVFKEAGIETKELSGEIALVFGYKDALAPAKIVYQFTQTNPNLKILAGFFENKLREAEEIITLAQLPTREELLARLAGSISSPMSGLVSVLQGNLRGLVYVFSRIKSES